MVSNDYDKHVIVFKLYGTGLRRNNEEKLIVHGTVGDRFESCSGPQNPCLTWDYFSDNNGHRDAVLVLGILPH